MGLDEFKGNEHNRRPKSLESEKERMTVFDSAVCVYAKCHTNNVHF